MVESLRVWSRAELSEVVAGDVPEGTHGMFRVSISPKLLVVIMDYVESLGSERVELIHAIGDPMAAELRFYKRDALPDHPIPFPECVRHGCDNHPDAL